MRAPAWFLLIASLQSGQMDRYERAPSIDCVGQYQSVERALPSNPAKYALYSCRSGHKICSGFDRVEMTDVLAYDRQMADEQYSAKETERRVKAAVHGAFNTPPKPLKSMTPKPSKPQRKVGVSKGDSKTR
jgi:hypothetical protein